MLKNVLKNVVLTCNGKSLTSDSPHKKELEKHILQPTIKKSLESLFKVSKLRLTRNDVDHILVFRSGYILSGGICKMETSQRRPSLGCTVTQLKK